MERGVRGLKQRGAENSHSPDVGWVRFATRIRHPWLRQAVQPTAILHLPRRLRD